ncbi:hypothetical protein Q7C36_002714 [Tachysurus vachellii]|uniref:Ig-like domain-containing protein n=1 Tax=Tachysurus vachellii TaxID=175792 RepID=A0AA88T7M2_TACVA|nr:hypothetical protein Q7C36_002714 [Tachysurus vachellii]
MNTKGSVIVLFLCFLSTFTLTDCSTCEINKLEGETLSLKLTDSSLNDNDRFTIKKGNTVSVPKRKRKEEGPGIVENNFIKLLKLNLSDAGSYTVEVFDGLGKNLNSYTKTVCVYAKVPKPRVNVTCQDGKIDIICEVEDSKDLSFTWKKKGKDLKKNEKVLTNVETSKYTCTAQNPAGNNTSDSVEASCYQNTLFGFDLWIMVSILAGGGTLVLLLIIVLVTLSCRSCKRKEKHQRDEEEFRLNYLNTIQPPQKGKQTARGQPAPPEPVNNGCADDESQAPCQAVPRPRNQQRARPPPPPIDDGEEPPPPLPQPRKKAHVKKQAPM